MKRGQALLLVGLEHVDAGRRQEPEHRQRQHDRADAERGQVHPAHARDEEHRGERGRIDHRRANVWLQEHEQQRDAPEPDRLGNGSRLAQPLRPVGEEAGEEEDEEQLPELGRLEAEEADVEPALRSARDGADEQHEQHHAGGADVDRSPVAAVVIRVDEKRRHERDAAEPPRTRSAA